MRIPVQVCANPCKYDHGTDMRVHAHGRARVRAGMRMQEVPATPPPRRYVGFAGIGWRLICWIVTQVLDMSGLDWPGVCGDVTQVQGVCWGWIGWGFAETGTLVSPNLKSDSLELVDRMGRWPGYGDLM